MTPAQARQHNAEQVKKIEASLQRLVGQLATRALPAALDDIGKEAVAHARATHTYQNQTGNLERSTTHAVIPPHTTGAFVYDSPEGSQSVDITNDKNEVMLLIGAGQPYGLFVELLYGFDVVVQSFIKLRRELAASLASRLRAQRLK